MREDRNEREGVKVKVPTTFEYVSKDMYCSHGCIQASRGKGERNHAEVRFTGCRARALFRVKPQLVGGEMEWKIVARIRSSSTTIRSHVRRSSSTDGERR